METKQLIEMIDQIENFTKDARFFEFTASYDLEKNDFLKLALEMNAYIIAPSDEIRYYYFLIKKERIHVSFNYRPEIKMIYEPLNTDDHVHNG